MGASVYEEPMNCYYCNSKLVTGYSAYMMLKSSHSTYLLCSERCCLEWEVALGVVLRRAETTKKIIEGRARTREFNKGRSGPRDLFHEGNEYRYIKYVVRPHNKKLCFYKIEECLWAIEKRKERCCDGWPDASKIIEQGVDEAMDNLGGWSLQSRPLALPQTATTIETMKLFHHIHHNKDNTHTVHHCGGLHEGADYIVDHCKCGFHIINAEVVQTLRHAINEFPVKIRFIEKCPHGKNQWHIESGIRVKK